LYLHNSTDCNFCYYSDDLIACDHCMFCSNLRNASYHFEDKKYDREEWEKLVSHYL